MPKFKKYIYNIIDHELDIKYYLLGAFISDGCVVLQSQNRKQLSISSVDRDWIEIIKNYICKDITINKNKSNCYKITLCQSDFINWFIENGCSSSKSLNVKFPKIPPQYLNDFIRGCWDGDGSLTYRRKFRIERNSTEIQRHASISSGSLDFIEKLHTVLLQLDIQNKIRTIKTQTNIIENRVVEFKNNYYVINITKKIDMIKLVNTIYYKGNRISMPRKQLIANNISSDPLLKVTSIIN